MWTWTLNWDEIRPDLVVGSGPITLEDLECVVRETGATALLSLQDHECWGRFSIDYPAQREHARRLGVAMRHVPMRDFDWDSQRRQLPAAVGALHDLLTTGHRVYVHCTAGINRSPLTILSYLVFVEAMAQEDAVSLLRERRPQVEPFLAAHESCHRDLVLRHETGIRRRAYEHWEHDPEPNAEANWGRAEREVIREAFTAAEPPCSPRASVRAT